MKRLIKTATNQILPSHLARQVFGELPVSATRALHSRATRRRLARLDGCRVNIGCGGQPTPGWVNLDLNSSSGVNFWDCRRGLPFSDNTVIAFYSEHMFEHLDPASEGKPFLRECLRCLRPGGVIRIVVPDAGAYLRAYGQGWEPLAAMRPLELTEKGWRDKWLGDIYQTQMQLINAVFRQVDQHKYAYDQETLVLFLEQAGYSRVILQGFGSSIDNAMAPDNKARQSESLYIEAVK
jgi:predicted SAM-dependent methyltransferase